MTKSWVKRWKRTRYHLLSKLSFYLNELSGKSTHFVPSATRLTLPHIGISIKYMNSRFSPIQGVSLNKSVFCWNYIVVFALIIKTISKLFSPFVVHFATLPSHSPQYVFKNNVNKAIWEFCRKSTWYGRFSRLAALRVTISKKTLF